MRGSHAYCCKVIIIKTRKTDDFHDDFHGHMHGRQHGRLPTMQRAMLFQAAPEMKLKSAGVAIGKKISEKWRHC